ncbi:hypothetical protein Bca101_087669 [Brassica carinata]
MSPFQLSAACVAVRLVLTGKIRGRVWVCVVSPGFDLVWVHRRCGVVLLESPPLSWYLDISDSFNQTQAEIPVSREASGLGSARGDVYAQASLAGKASPSLTFLPHGNVVVRRLGFPSTDIAKLSGVDTNQLKQRCRKAKITKTWSHVSSKVPAPFGNATLGQAPASGSASFLYC